MNEKYKEWLAREIEFCRQKATENEDVNPIAACMWDSRKEAYQMALDEFKYECELYA